MLGGVEMESLNMWGAVFLLIGGLAHLIPQLYAWLSFGGTPWIPMIVGLISVILALVMFFKK